MVSAYFVIGKLVVGRAGWRQQNDGWGAERLRILGRLGHCLVEGAATNMRNIGAKRLCKLVGCRADEIGPADLREV